MAKLWNTTIETHRREVHEAILDTTAQLVHAGGLRAVTMSQIADRTGIGRATLYKYFPDVDTILIAWHDREVSTHLDRLADTLARIDGAGARLEAALTASALHTFGARLHHETELASLLHRDEHVAHADQKLRTMIVELLAAAAAAGAIRSDIEPAELAEYCLHALAAASRVSDPAAVERLVATILAGLRAAD